MTDRFDLTHGSITDKLLFIALPIMATQLVQMAYNLTDMYWLGRLSSDAVAASGTAGMYLWLSVAFMMFGRTGAEIGVSQNIGRGDRDEAARYGESALRISIVLGLAFAVVLMLFKAPLIGFFNIREAHVDAMAQSYLFMVAPSVPVSFVSSAVTGCFNASGNSKVPFYINGVGLAFNMALDPIFIFTLGLGVEGAALATTLSQTVVCVIALYVVKRSKHRPFERLRILDKPSLGRARRIFRWSLPVALESLFFTFLSMVISRYIAVWGADAIAVYRVVTQLESLTWLIGEGFASAVTAYVGQNFGAKKWPRIHRGFNVSLAMMVSWSALVTAMLYICARPLIGAFLSGGEIIGMGVVCLRIMSVGQVFMCMEFVAAGAFRGMGRTLPPSLASICSNLARVLLAGVLSETALGLTGIWWAIILGAIARGVWMLVWYLLYSRRLPKNDMSQATTNA